MKKKQYIKEKVLKTYNKSLLGSYLLKQSEGVSFAGPDHPLNDIFFQIQGPIQGININDLYKCLEKNLGGENDKE